MKKTITQKFCYFSLAFFYCSNAFSQTANYIPRLTSPTTFMNSIIYENNPLLGVNNIGIGTIAAQNKLDVNGSVVIGSSLAGAYTAPSNSLMVENYLGVGFSGAFTPTSGLLFEVNGKARFSDIFLDNQFSTYGKILYAKPGGTGEVDGIAFPSSSSCALNPTYLRCDGTWADPTSSVAWALGGNNLTGSYGLGTNNSYPLQLLAGGANWIELATSGDITLYGPSYVGYSTGILTLDPAGLMGAAELNDIAWSPNGNSILSTNFFGSTNAQPLVFKTNGFETMRILSSTGSTTATAGKVRIKSLGNGGLVKSDANGELTNITSGTSTQYLKGDLTWGTFPVASSDWTLTGNSVSGSDFIGTTNSQPMRIKTTSAQPMSFYTQNVERMNIDANGKVGVNMGATALTEQFNLDGHFMFPYGGDGNGYCGDEGILSPYTRRIYVKAAPAGDNLGANLSINAGDDGGGTGPFGTNSHGGHLFLKAGNGLNTETGVGGNVVISGGNGVLHDTGAVFLDGSYTSISDHLYIGNGTYCDPISTLLTPLTYQLQLSKNLAAKPGSSTWTIVSDKRLKKDVTSYTEGLDLINKINPIRYKYNGLANTPTDQEFIGVFAQDMKEIAPYTVGSFSAKLNEDDKEATELLNFDNSALTYAMINAIKELNAKQNALKNEMQETDDLKIALQQEQQKNKDLQNTLVNLATRLEDMENKYNQICNLPCLYNNTINENPTGKNNKIENPIENKAILYQNIPNPFGGSSTVIPAFIPVTINNAEIVVVNELGQEIKRIPITQKGKCGLEFENILTSGKYYYSLYADGKLVDTKIMIKVSN